MSHLDDIEPMFWGPVGGILGLAITIVAIVWAVNADSKSEAFCVDHGEKYIDSREGYTLCEQDGGGVVRR